MLVNFMQNSSPENAVNKVIATIGSAECDLKGNCSILNPVLIVQDLSILTCNYAQIADFGGRYYYITDIITLNSNTLEVHLSVDVLMSFKSDILKSVAIIARNENMFDRYIPDPKFTIYSYERIQTKVFPNAFPDTGKLILIVAGK